VANVIDRARDVLARWRRRFRADLKASTDASFLTAPRFFGLLYGPIDRSLPIDKALRKALAHRLPAHVGWRHALGGVAYLLFMVMVITGVLLSLHYRPSSEEAYGSIQHIVTGVTFGWLVRDVHVWSATLIVIVVLAHMARVFFEGAYKPPRETSWLIGLMLLFVVLAFGATGYLLPWDQWAYWTVTEVLNTVAVFPLLGRLIVAAVTGDAFVSGATLSRFFALHVIILPWIAFALLIFHFRLIRTQGIAPPRGAVGSDALGVPFFPHHLLRLFLVTVVVLAIVITLATLFPRPLAEPASPVEPPGELVSTWVVMDVSLALIRFFGPWGFALFTLLGLSMAFIPLFDRHPERHHRPITVLGVVFFVGFAILWLVGHQLRFAHPDVGAPTPTEIAEPAQTGLE
jgi:quinol-cytochrome oxidoreductase complex cytochrome b subunit